MLYALDESRIAVTLEVPDKDAEQVWLYVVLE
jgi:hypothetical protein